MEIQETDNKVLWKRGEFSPFPQYFQYIFNLRSQIVYSFVKCACSIYFPQFFKSGVLRYGYIEEFLSPLDFEMTRVDCIWHMQKLGLYCRSRQKKHAFKNAQNERILHQPGHDKVLSGHLLSIETFDCVWSRPSLSAHDPKEALLTSTQSMFSWRDNNILYGYLSYR